jgi:integrase
MRDIVRPPGVVRELFITSDQADEIVAAIRDDRFRDFVLALRQTGCRPAEISGLTVDRVNLELGTWEVLNKTRRATGLKYRTIYLSPEIIEMSRRLVAHRKAGPAFVNTKGTRWKQQAIVDRFWRLRKRINLGAECVAYSFRHLYITDCLEKGIPPATVAQLVGHTSLSMIMRIYNKLKHRTSHLREAARTAYPGPTSPG